MWHYILKRILLMIPTLFLILLINFMIVQIAPGGPVEQAIQQIQSGHGWFEHSSISTQYQGAQGLSPEIIKKIQVQYGFDHPAPERFWLMLKGYLTLDFGTSFFKDKPVAQLIYEKLPVTLSLGLWSTLFIYLIAIPLGIKKAKKFGSHFDQLTSFLLAMSYAIPSFIFAILLIVLFVGGSYWQWFPLQGLVSENFSQLSFLAKIKDYFWHLFLPVLSIVLGSFAARTYLTQASFMDELRKPYVLTAKAKGLNDQQVIYSHVFRNAILVLVSTFPEAMVGILFTGNLFIEIIFNLDGIGTLGFEAITHRDYPVMFGILFILTLLGMLLRLMGDILYQWIDPRINFESKGMN